MKRLILIALSCVLSVTVSAHTTTNHKVKCPHYVTVAKLSDQLDFAVLLNHFYLVVTSKDVLNSESRSWSIGIYGITAADEADALAVGKYMVKKITFAKDILAEQISENVLLCHYGPGDIVAVTGSDSPNTLKKLL